MQVVLSRVERGRTVGRRDVYSRLRDAIVDATLEPGRRLSENELAGWLGVSRTPVREALSRLRDDRLVEVVPQLGTFVTPISDAGLRDAQFVRVALECAAVRLAAERAGSDQVQALEAILAKQAECRDSADFDGFYALDDELHSALCDISGHGIAWSLAQRANGHLNRVRRLSLPHPHYLEEMVDEHEAIVRAVAANDPDRAERALRHHLEMVLSALPAIRAEHPDFFADPEGDA